MCGPDGIWPSGLLVDCAAMSLAPSPAIKPWDSPAAVDLPSERETRGPEVSHGQPTNQCLSSPGRPRCPAVAWVPRAGGWVLREHRVCVSSWVWGLRGGPSLGSPVWWEMANQPRRILIRVLLVVILASRYCFVSMLFMLNPYLPKAVRHVASCSVNSFC